MTFAHLRSWRWCVQDAISSLSPEQQRFAKAYRAMQLEGSVFGVLIVQVRHLPTSPHISPIWAAFANLATLGVFIPSLSSSSPLLRSSMAFYHLLTRMCPLVAQLKPQLERLLNLPPDSLTKQIALTQRLLELFIDYQVRPPFSMSSSPT